MFRLDYKISPSPFGSANIDLREASETDLRYYCFLGDIILEKEGTDFSTQWAWVPIWDFALAIDNIVGSLEKDSKAQFEFTESEATITFNKMSDMVEIHSSYAQGAIEVEYEKLKEAADVLLKNLVKELTQKYPELKQNREFTKYMAASSTGNSLWQ